MQSTFYYAIGNAANNQHQQLRRLDRVLVGLAIASLLTPDNVPGLVDNF